MIGVGVLLLGLRLFGHVDKGLDLAHIAGLQVPGRSGVWRTDGTAAVSSSTLGSDPATVLRRVPSFVEFQGLPRGGCAPKATNRQAVPFHPLTAPWFPVAC
jgi:hypothetical protein